MFFSEKNYQGLNYTLSNTSLDSCVNFKKGPLVVESVELFHNTACALYK
jgi:hypothetical protein